MSTTDPGVVRGKTAQIVTLQTNDVERVQIYIYIYKKQTLHTARAVSNPAHNVSTTPYRKQNPCHTPQPSNRPRTVPPTSDGQPSDPSNTYCQSVSPTRTVNVRSCRVESSANTAPARWGRGPGRITRTHLVSLWRSIPAISAMFILLISRGRRDDQMSLTIPQKYTRRQPCPCPCWKTRLRLMAKEIDTRHKSRFRSSGPAHQNAPIRVEARGRDTYRGSCPHVEAYFVYSYG